MRARCATKQENVEKKTCAHSLNDSPPSTGQLNSRSTRPTFFPRLDSFVRFTRRKGFYSASAHGAHFFSARLEQDMPVIGIKAHTHG